MLWRVEGLRVREVALGVTVYCTCIVSLPVLAYGIFDSDTSTHIAACSTKPVHIAMECPACKQVLGRKAWSDSQWAKQDPGVMPMQACRACRRTMPENWLRSAWYEVAVSYYGIATVHCELLQAAILEINALSMKHVEHDNFHDESASSCSILEGGDGSYILATCALQLCPGIREHMSNAVTVGTYVEGAMHLLQRRRYIWAVKAILGYVRAVHKYLGRREGRPPSCAALSSWDSMLADAETFFEAYDNEPV